MTLPFPRTRQSVPGYDVDDVDAFLADARQAYASDDPENGAITAGSLRAAAFRMRPGGYSTAHVDAALERLEDAFALRERARALASVGEETWLAEAKGTAQEILNRIARPEGQRFTRSGRFTTGYDVDQVDAFTKSLYAYFTSGAPLGADDVRTVAFDAQRGGYDEAQVDYLLETVVEVILAVR